MASRMLTHEEARSFYDRLGARQDSQAFYEDRATDQLIAHADFEHAVRVAEFGCGTGRFAEKLLDARLPAPATYVGFDSSATMVELAKSRLARFGDRAVVRQTDGEPGFDLADDSLDRVVSNYVVDLLSDVDARRFFGEAQRVLRVGGLLGVVSLTYGRSVFSRIVIGGWELVHAVSPMLVGGCRPVELTSYPSEEDWDVHHREVVTAYGVPSEILVVARRAA